MGWSLPPLGAVARRLQYVQYAWPTPQGDRIDLKEDILNGTARMQLVAQRFGWPQTSLALQGNLILTENEFRIDGDVRGTGIFVRYDGAICAVYEASLHAKGRVVSGVRVEVGDCAIAIALTCPGGQKHVPRFDCRGGWRTRAIRDPMRM